MATKITILTQIITPRINYVCHQIAQWLGIEAKITAARDEAKTAIENGEPTINYSIDYIDGAINIMPCGLLHERGTKRYIEDEDEGEWEGVPMFFRTTGRDIPFDILSAIFYLITRYEEYGDTPKDKHGRYCAENSIAYKRGFLIRPVVDEWTEALRKMINAKFPNQRIEKGKYEHIPTVDVDNIYAYRNKGFVRHTPHIIKDLIKGRREDAKRRIRIVLHQEEDPYFNIEEVAKTISGKSEKGVMFFHCGCYGEYDKKTIFPSARYWRTKRRIDKMMTVGLHPSYRSAEKKWLLWIEKKALEVCLGRKVTACRMHYLRFALPRTAEMLISLGITDEYSMAYSNDPGFRAGTARPFAFYNLETEQERPLSLHPLIVMDKTMKSNLGLSADEAERYAEGLSEKCRANGVPFVTLFHNQNMGETEGWEGWKEMYERVLERLGMSK